MKQKGFTLLEVMVALTIFSLLSLMGYQILQGVLRHDELTHYHTERQRSLVRLFALLEQDLSQAMTPMDGAASLHQQHGFYAEKHSAEILRLTRRNWLNPSRLPRSSLQPVSWRLSDNILTRTSLNDGEITTTFNDIQHLTLRFWSEGAWHQRWTATLLLPQAVEVTLEAPPLGRISRIFLLAGEKK